MKVCSILSWMIRNTEDPWPRVGRRTTSNWRTKSSSADVCCRTGVTPYECYFPGPVDRNINAAAYSVQSTGSIHLPHFNPLLIECWCRVYLIYCVKCWIKNVLWIDEERRKLIKQTGDDRQSEQYKRKLVCAVLLRLSSPGCLRRVSDDTCQGHLLLSLVATQWAAFFKGL